MLLKHVLDLSRKIEEYRQMMYDLASNKGMNDPEVIRISQELDKKIIKLQQISINSIQYDLNNNMKFKKEAE